MLVLTRRKSEAIIVGDIVKIVVVEIRGDRVRLGVEADTSIGVHREEVLEAIRRDGRKVEPWTPAPSALRQPPPVENNPRIISVPPDVLKWLQAHAGRAVPVNDLLVALGVESDRLTGAAQ